MNTVTSLDGTTIAYDQSGAGTKIVFVTGAFNDRTTCAPLAHLLEPHFTVITYDRRGRGDSGDTAPYAIEREIEDLNALIGDGPAFVFGFSSGAILALKAAGPAITRLALYEPPYVAQEGDLAGELAALIAAGRRGDAVAHFQRSVGLPDEVIAQARQSPYWAGLEKLAHTLVYDATITADPAVPEPKIPTLVINGEQTWPGLAEAAATTAAALSQGQHRQVPGDAHHQITPETVAPVVREFFEAST